MRFRPGRAPTVFAAVLIIATGIALERTATEALIVVRPAVFIGVTVGVGFLLLGSSRWIGVASIPMLGAIVLEAGFGAEPSWVRSILIGCLWFAALEVSWEAIERRNGATYTAEATAARVQDVATVVAISLLLCFVAAASISFAPARSVLVQGSVLGGLLAASVVAVRLASARPVD